MSLRIADVKIITNYNWYDVRNLASWQAVKNTNENWTQPFQVTSVGQTISIKVEIVENNWLLIKETQNDWQKVSEAYLTWSDVKNI